MLHKEAKNQQFFVYLCVFLLIMIFTIILLEGVLQIYFRRTQGWWIFSGNENFTFPYVKRTHDRRQYTLRENYQDEHYTINEEGFRGEKIKKDGNPLICIIGDSVPYGAGVNDQETFPFHLQHILNQKGAHYQVLNAGVPSYNFRQSIDRWYFDIRPKYECKVIIISAANDVSLIDYYRKNWSPDLTWANVRFNVAATKRSTLLYYIDLVTNRIKEKKEDSDWENVALQTFKQDLNIQMNAFHDAKIPVVIMPINFCYYQNKPIDDPTNSHACKGYVNYVQQAKLWGNLTGNVNDILLDLSNSEGIYHLDVIVAFDEKLGRESEYIDFGHYSDSGNRKIAQLLADFLIEKKLIDDFSNKHI